MRKMKLSQVETLTTSTQTQIGLPTRDAVNSFGSCFFLPLRLALFNLYLFLDILDPQPSSLFEDIELVHSCPILSVLLHHVLRLHLPPLASQSGTAVQQLQQLV